MNRSRFAVTVAAVLAVAFTHAACQPTKMRGATPPTKNGPTTYGRPGSEYDPSRLPEGAVPGDESIPDGSLNSDALPAGSVTTSGNSGGQQSGPGDLITQILSAAIITAANTANSGGGTNTSTSGSTTTTTTGTGTNSTTTGTGTNTTGTGVNTGTGTNTTTTGTNTTTGTGTTNTTTGTYTKPGTTTGTGTSTTTTGTYTKPGTTTGTGTSTNTTTTTTRPIKLTVVQTEYEAWWKNCLAVAVYDMNGTLLSTADVSCNKDTNSIGTSVSLAARPWPQCNVIRTFVKTYKNQGSYCSDNQMKSGFVCNGPYGTTPDWTRSSLSGSSFFKFYDARFVSQHDSRIQAGTSFNWSSIESAARTYRGNGENRTMMGFYEDQPTLLGAGIDFNDFIFFIKSEGVKFTVDTGNASQNQAGCDSQ